LAIGDPFWAALKIRAEEVADALCPFEIADIDGEGGKNLKDAVEEDPAAEAGFAGTDAFEVSVEFEALELVDQRASCCIVRTSTPYKAGNRNTDR
jgi:hypothetical protein